MKNKILYLCMITLFPLTVNGLLEPYPPYYFLIVSERNGAQNYALPYLLNPAFTGSHNSGCNTNGRISFNNRFQKRDRNQIGDLNSTQIGYDHYVSAINSGFGVMVTHDNSTINGTTRSTVSAMYAHVLPIGRKFHLRTGINASIGETRYDTANLNKTGMRFPVKSVSYPNFTAGMVGYTKQFFVGLAVHNITEPVKAHYETMNPILHRTLILHGGWEIPLSKNENPLTLSPNMIITRNHYYYTNFQLGVYVNKGILVSGVWYNASSDAFTILLGIQKGRFRIGYSYGATLIPLGDLTYPKSHEFTISYNVFQNKQENNSLACRVPYPAF
jgi:type IX secretion system PorP/SprF family membrane protein